MSHNSMGLRARKLGTGVTGDRVHQQHPTRASMFSNPCPSRESIKS